MDEKITPVRGQTVLVRNEADVMVDNSGTDDGDDEICYIMQRAAGKVSKIGDHHCKSLKKARWRDAPRRLLPNRQLGFPGRPYISEQDHEKSCGALPFPYGWQGSRAS